MWNNSYATHASTGTSSSVLQLACGQDLLLAIPRSTTQAMLTGECTSSKTYVVGRSRVIKSKLPLHSFCILKSDCINKNLSYVTVLFRM